MPRFQPGELTPIGQRTTFAPGSLLPVPSNHPLRQQQPSLFERFVQAPAQETFQSSVELFKQSDPKAVMTPASRAMANTLSRAIGMENQGPGIVDKFQPLLGVLGATAGTALAPLERPLENIMRTAVTGYESMAGLALGLPADSPTFLRAQQNVDRLFNVSGEHRPTTGSTVGDFLADILTATVPVERAFAISAKLATTAVTKADVVRGVQKELGKEAAQEVSRRLPSNLAALPDARKGTAELGPATQGVPVGEPVRSTFQGASQGIPLAEGGGTVIPPGFVRAAEAPVDPMAVTRPIGGLPAPAGPFTPQGIIPGQKLLTAGPSVPGGARPGAIAGGRNFAATDITPSRIAGGRPGGLPENTPGTIVPVSRNRIPARDQLKRSFDEADDIPDAGQEAIPFLVPRARSGSVLGDEGYLQAVEKARREGSTFRRDRPLVQKHGERFRRLSEPRHQGARLPEEQIPLELTRGEMAIIRKVSQQHGVNMTEFAAKHFDGVNRTAPRTQAEKKLFLEHIDNLSGGGKPPKPPGRNNLTGTGSKGEPPDINPSKLVDDDFARPKVGIIPNMLNQMRLQGGVSEQLADGVDHLLKLSERLTGNAVANMEEAVKGFTAADHHALFLFQHRGVVPASSKIARAAAIIDRDAGTLIGEAIKNRVKVYQKVGRRREIGRIDRFFPVIADTDKIRANIDELSKYLVKTGQAEDLTQANQYLSAYVSRHKIRRFGSLENAREIDLPDNYILTDPTAVWKIYFSRGFRRMEEIKMFGQDGEKLLDPNSGLYRQIAAEGKDPGVAREAIERLTGTYSEVKFRENASAIARTANIVYLGLAQILNMSQVPTLGILRTNTRSFRKMVGELTTESGRMKMNDLALRSGSSLDAVLSELHTQLGGSDYATKFMKGIGFNMTERYNNVMASTMGKFYAEEMAETLVDLAGKNRLKSGKAQGAMSELRRLGIDPDDVIQTKGVLNSDQVQRAAQQVTIDSQRFGRLASQNLFQASAYGKIMFQFKNFSIGATRLIKNETIRQARRNPERFVRNVGKMAILFPAVGRAFKIAREGVVKGGIEAGVAGVFGDDREQDFFENLESTVTGIDRSDPLDEAVLSAVSLAFEVAGDPLPPESIEQIAAVISDAAYVGGMGIISDAWISTRYGASSVASMMFGPTAQTAINVATSLGTGDVIPLTEEGRRRIPIVGSSLPRVQRPGQNKGIPDIRPIGGIGGL